MAKRPIPSVDPTALSQLAGYFPDSGTTTSETATPTNAALTDSNHLNGTRFDRSRFDDPSMMEPPQMMSEATPGQSNTSARGGKTTMGPPPPKQAEGSSEDPSSGTGFTPSGRGAGFPPPPRSGGFPPPPQNVVPPPPPRRRSGGTFWSVLFALIALGAAGVAITAPSLRPELRAQLTAWFPDLPQTTVDVLTGQDSARMELTFNALDDRINDLTNTLTRLEGLDTVTPDQVRDLLLGTPVSARLDTLETGAERIAARLDGLDSRLASMEDAQAQTTDRINTWETALVTRSEDVSAALGDRIGTVRTAVGQVESSLTGSLAALSARLDDLEAKLDTVRADVTSSQARDADQTTAMADLTARLDAVIPQIETLRQSLDGVKDRVETLAETEATTSSNVATLEKAVGEASASLADLDGRLETLAALDGRVETLAATTETLNAGMATARQSTDATMMLLEDLAKLVEATQAQRTHAEAPLLGLIVLRRALNDNLPYQTAWSLSRSMLDKTLAATDDLMDVLGKNAGTGVRTLDDLRRDFQFIATQANKPIVPDVDWTGNVTSWFDYWFGDTAAPLGQPGVRQRAMVESIDDALAARRLDLAIEEAVMLSTRTESVLLSGWIADARQRQAVETAFAALEDRVLETASTAAPLSQSEKRSPPQGQLQGYLREHILNRDPSLTQTIAQ